MKIEKKLEENTLTVSLEGRLDTMSSPDLEKELVNLEEVDNLIFDFEKLEYISSAGLRVLLASQKKMNAQNGKMLVKNANEEIQNVFEITGFMDILTVE